jgi:PTH2 family peptidyl-tRNA hydrolase
MSVNELKNQEQLLKEVEELIRETVPIEDEIKNMNRTKGKEDPKQVIVVRKDLNMRKGKLAAQVAHASMKVFFDKATASYGDITISNCTQEMVDWVEGIFTKIVVYVTTEQELHDLKDKADNLNVPNALVMDAGKTEFKEPTYTCIAIGPDDPIYVDEITGDLPLM